MNQANIKNMMKLYPPSKISEQTKIRDILQQAALLGLERQGFFEKAAFYGGTSLRILYGLDRFSEDLDFTLLKPTPNFDFNHFLEGMKREVASFGFEVEVSQKLKNIDTPILSAFMKTNTIQLYLAIGDEKTSKTINHNEKIQIKLEVDIDPPLQFRVENRLVLNPTPFHVLTLHKSDLFAGKMHALLYRAWKGRVKGRDWYDLIWYIKNKVPLGLKHLKERLKQTKQLEAEIELDQDHVLNLLFSEIKEIDWENAKLDVFPFIADPSQLKIWSASFFTSLIEELLIEN